MFPLFARQISTNAPNVRVEVRPVPTLMAASSAVLLPVGVAFHTTTSRIFCSGLGAFTFNRGAFTLRPRKFWNVFNCY